MGEGGDREGMLLGLFTMGNNMGRATANAFAVLGLGWAGLVTTNCLEMLEVERELCEHDKIHIQPESLRLYLEFMVAAAAPGLELLICVLTYCFPIRPGSEMLAKVNEKQADVGSARMGSPSPSAKAAARKGTASTTSTA